MSDHKLTTYDDASVDLSITRDDLRYVVEARPGDDGMMYVAVRETGEEPRGYKDYKADTWTALEMIQLILRRDAPPSFIERHEIEQIIVEIANHQRQFA